MTRPQYTTLFPSTSSDWWRPAFRKVLPGAVLAIFLAYYWRIHNLTAQIPAYGDVLEYLWAFRWFGESLREGSGSLLFIPHVFMPEGWSLATFANGLGVFALGMPISLLVNEAATFNVLELGAFFVGYFGMYRLARLVVGRWTAILVALLFLLWGGRWVRSFGHLNILMGSALLPWIAFCVDRALTATGRRVWYWAIAAAALWALAITFSLYFIWIGFFLVTGWLLGAMFARRASVTWGLALMASIGVMAVVFCSPYLLLYWRGQVGAAGYDILHIAGWGMSVDGLFALYPDHPIIALRELALRQVHQVINESTVSGFGLLLLVLAAVGLLIRRRPPQWASLVVVAAVGIILALGPVLRWGNQTVSLPVARPLNAALWSLGHNLKEDIFPGAEPPSSLAEAVPLPGMLLSAIVPYFEGARVPSRYLLVAALGILLLAALALERLPWRWLRILVAALLLIEAARVPIVGQTFPPETHPAFVALAAMPIAPGESVLDLTAPAPGILALGAGGEVLWANFLHEKPIAGGGGSILPAHSAYLRDWFFGHPDPAGSAELPWLLRNMGIRYLMIHMPGDPAESLTRLVAGTDELLPRGCLEGTAAPPWNHSICLLEVAPAANPAINVFLAENWSGTESWGVWALGRESEARWAATNTEATHFAIEAFPYCENGEPLAGASQAMEIVVAGQVLATQRWEDCASWSGEIVVPPELISIGWNEMVLQFGRADRPIDVTSGANPDIRELSVGFTRLERLP